MNAATPPRPPLSRERILRAAIDLADRHGLDALTMRRLGASLDVEAMSLYKHVANKDDILDGIMDLVVAEIETPVAGTAWREAMRRRAISARQVFSRHSWAIGLLETRRTLGSAVLRYLDAVLGILRTAGFSVADAAHAFWLLDSYVYGHVIQETSMHFGTDDAAEPARVVLDQLTPSNYPHLAEAAHHALSFEFTVDGEFESGLDLILDAIDRSMAPAT